MIEKRVEINFKNLYEKCIKSDYKGRPDIKSIQKIIDEEIDEFC